MWTQTLPDSPGWYWMKPYEASDPTVVLVETGGLPGAALLRPALICRSLSQLAGTELWQGPIQAPD